MLKEENTREEDDREGKKDKKEKLDRDTNKEKKGFWRRKSLMELLVMSAPLIHCFNILYPAFYYLSMDIQILSISVFPGQSRNVLRILLCLTWDTVVWAIVLSLGVYFPFIIISFVLTFKDSVDLAIARISRYPLIIKCHHFIPSELRSKMTSNSMTIPWTFSIKIPCK